MTMAHQGLAKLLEECGELVQAAGKRLAYMHTESHPDGGPPLTKRLEDESGDVIAAIYLVGEVHGLDLENVKRRMEHKLKIFRRWQAEPDAPFPGDDLKDTVLLRSKDWGMVICAETTPREDGHLHYRVLFPLRETDHSRLPTTLEMLDIDGWRPPAFKVGDTVLMGEGRVVWTVSNVSYAHAEWRYTVRGADATGSFCTGIPESSLTRIYIKEQEDT